MSTRDENVQIGNLSESLEDYLETIFRQLQKQKVTRVRDIAKAKGVRTSSVVSALRRLSREGLVKYRAREFVDLTQPGRALAFRLYQRHTFLKRFLVDVLQVDPETAEQDACQMEHAISVTTLDRIASMSEFITYCPDVDSELINRFRDRWLVHLEHGGDGCGGKGQKRRKREAKLGLVDGVLPLHELERDEGGYVARIVARDEDRRKLIRNGVLPGASIHLIEKHEDGSIDLHLAGERMRLSEEEVASIQVWPHGGWTNPDGSDGAGEHHRTLADMTPGRTFRVIKLKASGEIRQRLADLGFIRGAKGRILREALLRDPIEIELNGSLLSMRRVEATAIVVEELDTEAENA